MATTNRLRDLAPRQAPRESPLAGGFMLLAVAALVVGGAGVGGFMLLSSKPAPPDVATDLLSAATGRRDASAPATAPAEVDDGTWGDADLRRCDTEAADAAEAASKRKLAAVSANRVGLGAPEASFVQRAAYLLCSARNKPRHLCQRYWHDRLVDGVKAYAREFADVRQSAYWTKVGLAEQARASSSASQEALRATAADIDQTTRDVMKLNQEIADALRLLVANGILSRDDFGFVFGFGVPPDIRTLLGDGQAVRNVCG
jgi:hypothetical protein